MSDTKLRDLERRWKETGAVDDEAAYLRERVRVGNLTRERLELAAWCGNSGAAAATGATAWTTLPNLLALGDEVVLRAAVAVSRRALEVWDARVGPSQLKGLAERPGRAVRAAGDWLRCPCSDHRRSVDRTLPATWQKDVLMAVSKLVTGVASPMLPASDPKLASAGYLSFCASRTLVHGVKHFEDFVTEGTTDNAPYLAAALTRNEVKDAVLNDLRSWSLAGS